MVLVVAAVLLTGSGRSHALTDPDSPAARSVVSQVSPLLRGIPSFGR